MKLNFDQIEETVIPQFRGGNKDTRARMHVDSDNRIMRGVLESGASIGMHAHTDGSEIVYILSGRATMLYDDGVETLEAGECHYCPRGHRHSLINEGKEDLVFFAVVPKHGV